MTPDEFMALFEQFAEAPNAVASMRALVLSFAVSGKLCHGQQDGWQEVPLGDVIELISGQHLLAEDHNSEGRGIPYLTGPSDFGDLHPLPTRWTDRPKVIAQPGDILITVSEKNTGRPFPYLRNTNVHWFRFELESVKTMLFQPSEVDEYFVEPGDILICEGGHGISRSAVWDGQIARITFQKALHRVRPFSCLSGHFLTFCLWFYERDGLLQRYYTGAGIPHFTGKSLAMVSFPLPPLPEQRRIVAKVDELMALVDKLEAQLAESRATATRLMDAIVAKLTSSPAPHQRKAS
jgi:hypothetical protein